MSRHDQGREGEGSSARVHPIATIGLALAGLASLAYVLAKMVRRGDEAPIRVRGGSIVLDLLGTQKWQRDGNHWRIDSGARVHDDYGLQIGARAGCHYDGTRKSRIRIIYSDSQSILIRSVGFHTKVETDPHVGLRLSNNDRTLSYERGGHISAIELDGQPVCSFAASDFDYLETAD